jgi:hypothetical protein
MTVAVIAVVISVLALLFSAAAVKYTRDQARSAGAQLHRDRTPNVDAAVEFSYGDQTAGTLVVTHVDGPDLDSVEIEIVVPGGSSVDLPVPSFGPGKQTKVRKLGSLRQGGIERVSVILNAAQPDTAAVFRFTCRRGREEPWVITRRVVPDWPPSIVV